MLVLCRKKHEPPVLVKIDGKVVAKVSVVDVRGEKVRIAFEADRGVEFVREELETGNAAGRKS